VTKGYKKDFIFEITLDKAQNTEQLNGSVEILIANASFNAENLNKKAFNVNCDLKIIVHNESAKVEIKLNDEVMKNLIRVKGAEAMQRAQDLEDMCDYDNGEKVLIEMEQECDLYANDDVLVELKENIVKRKKYMTNSKNGIYNDCNVKAFNMNICEAFSEQECKAGFTKNLYKNRTQNIMSNKLAFQKSSK